MPAAVRTPDGIARIMARANPSLAKPEKARGRCYEMASRLSMAMQERGLSPKMVEAHWESWLSYGNHFAVEHEGMVYDLTLRQFAPHVDVPWVGTTEEWLTLLDDQVGSPVSIRVSL